VDVKEGPRTGLARTLRRRETDAERKLWSRIRDRQFLGLKFRRQVPVSGFIADFLCYEAKLIVELDGGQHSERSEQDALRTKTLNEAGFLVIRFWNNDVLVNSDGVLTAIAEELRAAGRMIEGSPLTPALSPWERGPAAAVAHGQREIKWR
jgi:very-short-patch-repair endonuclease